VSRLRWQPRAAAKGTCTTLGTHGNAPHRTSACAWPICRICDTGNSPRITREKTSERDRNGGDAGDDSAWDTDTDSSSVFEDDDAHDVSDDDRSNESSGADLDVGSSDQDQGSNAFQRFNESKCVWPPTQGAKPEHIALGYMLVLALKKGTQQLSKADMETDIQLDRERAQGAEYMKHVPKTWDAIRRCDRPLVDNRMTNVM